MIPSLNINIKLSEPDDKEIYFEINIDDIVIIESSLDYERNLEILSDKKSDVISNLFLKEITEKIILENIKDLFFNTKSKFIKIDSNINEVIRSSFENNYLLINEKSLSNTEEIDFNYFKHCIKSTIDKKILEIEKSTNKELQTLEKLDIQKKIISLDQFSNAETTQKLNNFNNKIEDLISKNRKISALINIQDGIKTNIKENEKLKEDLYINKDCIINDIKSNNLLKFFINLDNFIYLENDYKTNLNNIKFMCDIINEINFKDIEKNELQLIKNLIKEIINELQPIYKDNTQIKTLTLKINDKKNNDRIID